MSRVVRNIFWLFLSNMLTKLLWAGSLVLLIRHLGPEQYGLLASVWAFAGIVAGMTDLGSSQALVRECSRHEDHLPSFFRSVMIIKSWCTLPAWIVVTISSFYLFRTASASTVTLVLVLAIAAATPFLDSFSVPLSAVTQVKHRLDVFSWWRSSYFLAVFVLLLVMVKNKGTMLQVSWAYLAATGFFLLFFLWQLRRYLAFSARTHHLPMRTVIEHGMPFLLTSILALAYYRLDVMLLGSLDSPQAAGIYSAQYQIILLMYSISAIVFSAVFPDLYRNSHDHRYLTTQFRRICRYLNLLAWLSTPIIFLYSREIMQLLGGARFIEGHESLRILSLFIPMYVITVALNFLTSLDNLGARIRCEICGILLTGVGGILVIPHFSIIGMATVALLGYLVSGIFALNILYRKHQFNLWSVFEDFMLIGLKALPAFTILLAPGLPWWLKSVLFFGLFFFSLSVFRFWDEGDRDVLTRIMKMRYSSKT
jgi:O-antigen/teichoic acid export membrane protein